MTFSVKLTKQLKREKDEVDKLTQKLRKLQLQFDDHNMVTDSGRITGKNIKYTGIYTGFKGRGEVARAEFFLYLHDH